MDKIKLSKKWERALANENRVRQIREQKYPEMKKLNDAVEKTLKVIIIDIQRLTKDTRQEIIDRWKNIYENYQTIIKNKDYNEINKNLELSTYASKSVYVAQFLNHLKHIKGLS